MYAIIRDRGREFKVSEGNVIKIDRIQVQEGDSIEFDEVLLYSGEEGMEVGQPLVSGASVTGEILGEAKSAKTVALKFRRRKDSRTKKGHRQKFTSIKITAISKP